MLSSIHPFGERARKQRYGATVAAYIVGALFGGLVLGAGLALLAIPIPSTTFTSVLALAVLIVCAVWDLRGSKVPSLERQVDEDWLSRYRGWVYGVGYGFQLGVGFVTFVKSALVYGFAVAAILAGSPLAAVLAGSLFGLTRGLSILSTLRVESPTDLRAFFDRLTSSAATVRHLGAATVVGVCLIGLVVLA